MARYLSGIQPSGHLHLGNYFGAIRQHIAAQDDAFYFIANYHALTTVNDAATLRDNTFDVAATYLALGLDPKRAVLFRQSDVPEVCELTWLLATVTGMGLLEKAVSYKEKKEHGISASVGLFTYPVLMASDILIYDSDVVPVGSDQVQHVELTRDMAGRFNTMYGETFKLPTYVLGTPVPVPGIDGQKMSKSYGNHIPLFAEGKELKRLVGAIQTDSKGLDDPKDPDTCNVFAIYKLFASQAEQAALAARYRAGGFGYGHAKQELIAKIDETFGPARERRRELQADPDQVEQVLLDGAARARAIARTVLGRARRACGID
ncbi:MAG: tryptophan--tRNA ligase [Myxococcales bacterium]|nr:tryptophan--tRNA ligase [Myxococcales bacterium]MCB9531586.1 tryptophan--tRNA ligase [Myxococcales bacterium]MCB9532762.1 tryptophan--tRNA ligase [Myxococcales bacterium]